MKRACARALETEVTSLLSRFHFDAHETWLLPHTDTLCKLRYHGEANKQGEEEEEDGREEGEEEVMKKKLQAPNYRPGPDVDDLQAPDVRPSPDDRRHHTRAKSTDFWSPTDD
ncbi:hypothetical protein CFC21_097994 [Triticum aestivum]|uniref:Uncharacterized protein n=2 Tax=Triticum aestivum TaxID=4565 RepID=A0A9R1N0B5_WHEAT|nr:hypothetical protein CFC21_097994 [Triticum aestivum]